ncbi:hypothetical protein GR160_07665 [Flavobacterium sp. Sd200]|uniref:hypothetical protein n=1 Tax=Flavobacterium sp. Sd200 TaxID=2692211 RepID=UPI00136B049C|nr:hypothetical protein [Flavobacterium sp. Sd200]MXN91105.1 hypothetical protein [Flavobacterium sp. Sd200]
MDLLSAANNAASIKKFVEQDLVSLLIDLQFNAAASTLSGVEKAIDKKSVYWSAITNFNVAQEGLKRKLTSKNRFEVAKQFIYLSALIATIYKYLGEDGLVEKCYDDTLEVVKTQRVNEKKYEIIDNFSAWLPKNWIESNRIRGSVFGQRSLRFDAQEFWRQLSNKSESLLLLVIDPDPGPNGSYMDYR